jgi:hypothetical protein
MHGLIRSSELSPKKPEDFPNAHNRNYTPLHIANCQTQTFEPDLAC